MESRALDSRNWAGAGVGYHCNSKGRGLSGACLAVSCEGVKLQAGACDHDKVAVSSLGPEEADDGALTLPGALQYILAVIILYDITSLLLYDSLA